MIYPYLDAIQTGRQVVEEFKGYDHNLRIGEGEFFDMTNMTSDYYPVLSPRGQRGVYASDGPYYGMIAKDAFCYVKGGKFYINNSEVEKLELEEGGKQLVSMGAYVIILPDKKWVNTADGTFGNIEASYESDASVEVSFAMCKLDGSLYGEIIQQETTPENPADRQLWIDTSETPHSLKQYSADTKVWTAIASTYIRITATGIAKDFAQYDAVKISGFPDKLKDMDGATYVIWEAKHYDDNSGTDYIVITGLLEEAIENWPDCKLTVTREMPKMDFVIESGNRLWGCYYGLKNGQAVNEIYCSKLGDFKNWECYMGVSTDSWAASCGTDGQWTGAITHLGYPLFFKENYLHKIYGNYPSNYQIQVTECQGVAKGSGKSLAIVGTTLFYKGRSGVYAYDGGLPSSVSYALGNEVYRDSVGGAVGNKYYISMENTDGGGYNLFVFDVAKSMWHKEDRNLQVVDFCACDGELYAITGDQIITMLGTGTKDTKPVEWMVETGKLGVADPDTQTLQRLHLRMQMELGSEVYISVQYDCEDGWHQVGYVMGDCLQSFLLPIRPRRCQFLRLKLEGRGDVKIYSMTKTISGGSDKV